MTNTPPSPPAADNKLKRYMVGFWALLVAAVPVLGFFITTFTDLRQEIRDSESNKTDLDVANLKVERMKIELATLRAEVDNRYAARIKAAEQLLTDFEEKEWSGLAPKLAQEWNKSEEKINDRPYAYSPATVASFKPLQPQIKDLYGDINSCIKTGACNADNMYDLYCSKSKRIIMGYYRFSGQMYAKDVEVMKVYKFLVECAHHFLWPGENKEGWYDEYLQAGGEPLLGPFVPQ